MKNVGKLLKFQTLLETSIKIVKSITPGFLKPTKKSTNQTFSVFRDDFYNAQ